MFAPLKKCRIEYVSLFDPALDDAALTEETIRRYAESPDLSLLPLRPDATPNVWTLEPLDRYSLRLATESAPLKPDGTISVTLAYHLVQHGLKAVALAKPEDAPGFHLRRSGLAELVCDDFVRAIPPEVAEELGGVLYMLSRATDVQKKTSNSPSGEEKSKSESTAPAAPIE